LRVFIHAILSLTTQTLYICYSYVKLIGINLWNTVVLVLS